VYISGSNFNESWVRSNTPSNIFSLLEILQHLLYKFSINYELQQGSHNLFEQVSDIICNQKNIGKIGKVEPKTKKNFDLKNDVFYFEIDFDAYVKLANNNKIVFSALPQFHAVRRDLALVLDKNIEYKQLKQLAFKTEKKLLKTVNLFDVYEGDKIDSNKKSYALSFMLNSNEQTLTDTEIEKTISKLIEAFKTELGATIRE
jgi:phenylalanyl-tRNA synthetase beta chain